MTEMKLTHGQERRSVRRIVGYASRLMLICLLALSGTILLFPSPVQAQPLIIPSSLPNGQSGSPYPATTLGVTGGTAPYTWSFSSGTFPPGLSLSAAGVISGTPTTTGTFNFIVQVTDSLAATDQEGFSITITSPPLTITTTSLSTATEGTVYTATLGVTGGTAPYTWTIVTGSLPTGLILAATNGVIAGTPAHGTIGSSSFVIGVTDSSSPALSGQKSLSILVEAGSFTPSVTIGSGLKAGETKVLVGASKVATLRGGESISLTFDLGISQAISVEPLVEHPTEAGVRFKAEEDTITVSEFSPNASFVYYTEYQIDLETNPSDAAQLGGSGWYKEGHTLRVSPPTKIEIEDQPGTQYRFSHWKLPTGETVSDEDLSLTVSAPGSCTAHYDTYYQLTLTSPYGEQEASAWYKAGSQAEWGFETHEVKMSGILGFFGGKMKAVNYSGAETMDGPKSIAVDWEPDYTMPAILIPLALLLFVFGIYILYRLWRGLQPTPIPVAPPPQPIPPPQTTVVMIGDKARQGPPTTRDQLMEKFGELLDKYGQEITASIGPTQAEGPPRIETVRQQKGLPAPEPVPPDIVEGEVVPEEEGAPCDFTTKKLLRVVVSNWRHVETKGAGPAMLWKRDVYQEWEILTCSLPHGHKEPHQGSLQIVYSLLNTVTEEKVCEPGQKGGPPESHYTDGMPQVEIAADQVVSSDQLPTETAS
jgi:hypothetical protein